MSVNMKHEDFWNLFNYDEQVAINEKVNSNVLVTFHWRVSMVIQPMVSRQGFTDMVYQFWNTGCFNTVEDLTGEVRYNWLMENAIPEEGPMPSYTFTWPE